MAKSELMAFSIDAVWLHKGLSCAGALHQVSASASPWLGQPL